MTKAYSTIREGAAFLVNPPRARFALTGSAVCDAMDELVGANMFDLYEGRAAQTVMLDESGSVAAIVWILVEDERCLVLCEPEDRMEVGRRLAATRAAGIVVEDVTVELGEILIAGPKAAPIAEAVLGDAILSLEFLGVTDLAGQGLTAARLGILGEWELSLFGRQEACAAAAAALESGGLEEVDSAALPVLMAEMRTLSRPRDIPRGSTLLQTGLQWMVDFRKETFVGKEALEVAKGCRSPKCTLLLVDGDTPLKTGTPVMIEGQAFGSVQSTYWSPTLGQTVAYAYIDPDLSWPGIGFAVAGRRACSVAAPTFLTRSILATMK